MTDFYENNFADFSDVVQVKKKIKISYSRWWRFQLATSPILGESQEDWSIPDLLVVPLKKYSLILTISFYDMKQKKLISKISVDSNFTFTSYTRSCCVSLLHRLFCLINSHQQDLLQKIALIS